MFLPQSTHRFTCDIFCRVINNFGDASVCWRLAQQLANEYNWQIRLFIDELTILAQLAPGLDAGRKQQVLSNVSIEYWDHSAFIEPSAKVLNIADVIIEAFACDLPAPYIAAMAQRLSPVAWINLEYLSSEDWVSDFHLRQSPHPRYALTKTFFFPGLYAQTGGVLCEKNLNAQRRAFIESTTEQACWWTSLGLPQPDPAATVVSLFSYENSAINVLLEQWRDATNPLVLLVPQGKISGSIARFFGRSMGLRAFSAGMSASVCSLSAYSLPFTDQIGYDKLLWSSHINFVRGEDSFVRAQWARKPFVWHIYAQADNAHLPKLDAALANISSALKPPARDALTRFSNAWNSYPAHSPPDWLDFIRHREAFEENANSWANKLASIGDLAQHLAAFVQNILK
ncbi:elongation factor P maturation arginine rhamnosyltransferase EarP [Candidatus Vallotia cooleyia]|uniref:elongation factor P maturation arginine rhamnosyltransferase EarP n=1 Tax=Candidatus Vallotiella adelgis TaxID=1177211 RepID=UPI003B96854F